MKIWTGLAILLLTLPLFYLVGGLFLNVVVDGGSGYHP